MHLGERRRPRGNASPAADSTMVDAVRNSVLAGAEPATAAGVASAIRSTGRLLGSVGALRAAEQIHAELQGLGPLQYLVQDETVTDILVNGTTQVWVDGAQGLQQVQERFTHDSEVRALAVRLVAAGGRRLDDGNPCVDVRFGPFRVHAVLPPLSTTGTLLSIRIRRSAGFTLAELEASGSLAPEFAAILRSVVRSRLNFLVSGGTGTGKTTLLSTLLGLSAGTERLVLVEDSAELEPDHPHAVGLQSRHGNLEGSGIVGLDELVRQALRMRPDRLVVGECRGSEVRELLTAMNTGHDGAGGTIHANSAASVPARLTALGALAGMGNSALALQAASALDVVIHLTRSAAGRRVTEVGVFDLDRTDRLLVRPALTRTPSGCIRGEGWAALQERLAARQAML